MSVNKLIILGRVGKDAESKDVSNGKMVKFSVATSKKYKNTKAEMIEDTTWHNVVAFGKLAEICSQYVKKGMQVYIEGEVQNKSYEKDGETKYYTQVLASTVQFIGGDKKEDNPTPKPRDVESKKEAPEFDASDELPF